MELKLIGKRGCAELLLMRHNWCTEFKARGNGDEVYGQGIARSDTTHSEVANLLLGFYFELKSKQIYIWRCLVCDTLGCYYLACFAAHQHALCKAGNNDPYHKFIYCPYVYEYIVPYSPWLLISRRSGLSLDSMLRGGPTFYLIQHLSLYMPFWQL